MTVRRSAPTTTTYALLGLLRLRSWTTYELAKQAQRSLNWFWPRAERKLYDEPKHLVDAGLATASAQATGKRPKTVYAITDSGREALRAWLDQPSAPRTGEFEAMVKVFFADAGTLEQLRTTLARIEEEAVARTAQLRDLTDQILAAPNFPERLHLNALCVRLQIDQEITIQRWAAWAQQQIDTWAGAHDPGPWDPRKTLTQLTKTS